MLILWDVDGTMRRTGRALYRAFKKATKRRNPFKRIEERDFYKDEDAFGKVMGIAQHLSLRRVGAFKELLLGLEIIYSLSSMEYDIKKVLTHPNPLKESLDLLVLQEGQVAKAKLPLFILEMIPPLMKEFAELKAREFAIETINMLDAKGYDQGIITASPGLTSLWVERFVERPLGRQIFKRELIFERQRDKNRAFGRALFIKPSSQVIYIGDCGTDISAFLTATKEWRFEGTMFLVESEFTIKPVVERIIKNQNIFRLNENLHILPNHILPETGKRILEIGEDVESILHELV